MRSRRECTYKAHKSRLDCIYTYNNLDENTGIMLASRRDMCYDYTVPTQSRRVMYDDYDLDYTYSNDYAQDSEEYTQDLDEEYVRDGHDYESLAYRHYA
jgi:hypothetical protein